MVCIGFIFYMKMELGGSPLIEKNIWAKFLHSLQYIVFPSVWKIVHFSCSASVMIFKLNACDMLFDSLTIVMYFKIRTCL